MTGLKKTILIYSRKLTAVLMSAVMILCFVYVRAEAGSYFTGYVYADEPGIAVGGISIDIYGSTLRSSANGLKRYEHYYCRTVKTDSSGAFTFARPSTKTLLKVDLGSLPSGTGVNAQTRLVSSRYDDTFRLSYINRIGIGKSGDGSVYKVELTAADGTPLFADYDVSETVTTNAVNITYDTLNSVRLDRTVAVRAGGLTKSRTFNLDISNCTVSGKLNKLLEYGIIDEEMKDEMIDVYAEDTAPVEDPRPDFVSERTYTVGNFMLHSEQGTPGIEQFERVVDEVVDVYFRKYGFLEPYHEFVNGSSSVREKYFHIYIVDNDVIRIDSEVAPKNVLGTTKKIDPEDPAKGCYIVLSPGDALKFKWVLGHEMFHCIMYRYIGKNQAGWFKEAFANYGSYLCIGGSFGSLNTHMTNYLKSTDYPLSSSSSYRNRQYGAFLLPLYIHKNYGGVEAIKNILTAYAKTTSAYKAINNGLKATNSNYTFAKLFAGFKDKNSYTDFYGITDLTNPSKIIRKKASRTIIASFDDSDTAATPQMTLAGNSAAYFEFAAPASSSGTLTVTIDTSSGAADASYNLVLHGKKIAIPPRGKAYPLMTFVLSGFGSGTDSAVLTAGNTSMSSKTELNFIAWAHFEEK